MSESEPVSGSGVGTGIGPAAESGSGTCVGAEGAEGGTSVSTVIGSASTNTLS